MLKEINAIIKKGEKKTVDHCILRGYQTLSSNMFTAHARYKGHCGMHINFNKLQGAGLFLEESTVSYSNNAVFIHNYISCLGSSYEFIPIRAHAAFATQHMPV